MWNGTSANLWGPLGTAGRDFDREYQGSEGEQVCSQTVFRSNEMVQNGSGDLRPIVKVGCGRDQVLGNLISFHPAQFLK